MRPTKLWPALFLLAATGLWPSSASSYDPYLVVPPPQVVHSSPSYRYARMTGQQALAELRRRGILFQRVHEKVGRVVTPIRLTGRLHGVYIHSSLPEEQRTTTIFEICDARFALALDDFAAILQKHGIVEVVHYTMYRPAMGGVSWWHVGSGSNKVVELGDLSQEVMTAANPVQSWWRSVQPPDVEPWSWMVTQFAKKVHHGAKKVGHPKGDDASVSDESADLNRKAHGETAKGEAAGAKTSSQGKRKGTSNKVAKSPRGRASKSKVARRSRHGKVTGRSRSASKGTKRHGKVRHKSIKHGVKPHRSRHPDGLAIDVGALRKRDGTWLRVSNDFHGTIGAQTCGAGAKPPEDPKGKELWDIVCEAFDEKVFTYVLTPNFNLAHQDHFHMEIKPGMRWFLYH